jgi:hypothetical protein
MYRPKSRLAAFLTAGAALMIPLGSYLKDGGILHGLAIAACLLATGLIALDIRREG